MFGRSRGGGCGGHVERKAEVGVELIEDFRTGCDDLDETLLGEEPGSPGGDGIGVGQPRGDFGEGHPEGEGFSCGVEGLGDFAEGEGGAVESGEEAGLLVGSWGAGSWDGRAGHLGESTVFVWMCQVDLLGFVWIL